MYTPYTLYSKPHKGIWTRGIDWNAKKRWILCGGQVEILYCCWPRIAEKENSSRVGRLFYEVYKATPWEPVRIDSPSFRRHSPCPENDFKYNNDIYFYGKNKNENENKTYPIILLSILLRARTHDARIHAHAFLRVK